MTVERASTPRLPRDAHARMARALRNPSLIVVASAAIQSLMRLGSNVVLARLLTPTAFALTSITMLVLTGMQMVSDIGVAMLALRRGSMTAEEEAKLWTMQFVRGIGLGTAVFVAAGPIAGAYGNPELAGVMRALALMPMLQGAQSLFPVMALGRRDLVPSFVIDVGGRLAGVLVSIGVALVSPTVWALVAGTLANYLLNVVVSFALSGRWPRFVFDRGFLREQWRFSRWIQISSTLSFAGMQIDKALFPFLFGVPAFGLYSIGATFAVIPSQVTQKWSASVYYPLIVQMLRGGARARSILLRVRLTMLLYSAVVTVIMMAGAPLFFALLYKPSYHPAARVAELLAAGTFFEVAESSLRHFPLVDGTPRYEVIAVMVRLAAFGALVVLLRGGGVDGYALSYVGALACSHLFMLVVCARRGYVAAVADLTVSVPILGLVLLAYAVPLTIPKAGDALWRGALIALCGSLVLAGIYRRRGLPSLPAALAPETTEDLARHDTGSASERD